MKQTNDTCKLSEYIQETNDQCEVWKRRNKRFLCLAIPAFVVYTISSIVMLKRFIAFRKKFKMN